MTIPADDLLENERPLLRRGEVVVGIDEVGRGALAGPLLVGAVVLRSELPPPSGLNDSKLLTPNQRQALADPIVEWAHEWSLGTVSATEIDSWGLRLALAVAATRALDALKSSPTHALIDGPINLLSSPLEACLGEAPPPSPVLRFAALPFTTLVKGDQRSASIAAAAVLAKVHRDEIMKGLHDEYHCYDWLNNKGYGAPRHLAALRAWGPCTYHRRTWRLPLRDATEGLSEQVP